MKNKWERPEISEEKKNAIKPQVHKNSYEEGNQAKKGKWQGNRLWKRAAAVVLCAATLLGSFSGIRMLNTVRSMNYEVLHGDTVDTDFLKSQAFSEELDGYMQLFALYQQVCAKVETRGYYDSGKTMLLSIQDGMQIPTSLSDLLEEETSYDYKSYLEDYCNNLNKNIRKGISLNELFAPMHALDEMVVMDETEHNIYWTPDFGQQQKIEARVLKLDKKEPKEFQKTKDALYGHLYKNDEIKLPGKDANTVQTQKVSVLIGDISRDLTLRNDYEKWLFSQYTEYAMAYLQKKVAESYQNGFIGETSGEINQEYKKAFNKSYKDACYLSDEFDIKSMQSNSTYFDYERNMNRPLDKYKYFYLKDGTKLTFRMLSQLVTDESGEDIYSMTKQDYAQKLIQDAKLKIKHLSAEAKPAQLFQEEANGVPRPMADAVAYAHFLKDAYDVLGSFFSSKVTSFYYVSYTDGNIDQKIMTSAAWSSHLVKLRNGKEETRESLNERTTSFAYAFYKESSGGLTTNLSRDEYPMSGSMQDYLSSLTAASGANASAGIGVDMDNLRKKAANKKPADPMAQTYKNYKKAQMQIADRQKSIDTDTYLLAACMLLILLACCVLLWMTGHEEGTNEIVLKAYDRKPQELYWIIGILAGVTFLALCHVFYYAGSDEVVGISGMIGHTVCGTYLPDMVVLSALTWIVVFCALTLAKQIKAHVFWSDSYFYQLFVQKKYLETRWYKVYRHVDENIGEWTAKRRYLALTALEIAGFFILFLGYLIIGDASYMEVGGVVILLVLFLIILLICNLRLLYKSFYHADADRKIEQGLQKIIDGNLQYQLPDIPDVNYEKKKVIEGINHITEGLDKAVEKSVQSEKMKTELITNVSHDIKTPLTSVINYVDLLKREHLENEKAQEYLEILDQKSQRLKVLIEDLIEASKASSGALELQITPINLKELVNQTDAEFEDKMQQAGLKCIVHMAEDEIIILGDGRRVYRILENLYGNVVKYAMHGTRVYVDLYQKGDMAVFTIKNISAEELNITAEELTERFVRGESSRTTEGSGLGLSIAQSLTELMKGNFEIHLDGDLFAANVAFPLKVTQPDKEDQ